MHRLFFLICFLLTTHVCSAQNDSLYVFVGEKISVEEFKPVLDTTRPPDLPPGDFLSPIISDYAFKAKYKIIKNVHNKFDKDTIEFDVYDHMGKPSFAAYKNVLLFVILEADGKLYHFKYQYFDVYPTSDGQWASPGDPYRFDESRFKEDERDVKIQDIKFKESVMIDLSAFNQKAFDKYLAPYFDVKDKKRAKPLKVLMLMICSK
ncbi:hypothetical protein IM792_16635 [Mucilaginibacter sp. JRF]|uniref:hypothetical protein n=1 Tax=Mucilaginibacter sp. JRF TaxID=2780088 RepID=UPI00187ED9CD|nr:hypothetical protein [Mucilaginibacter sp. JRF]MBE9586082.1 hypothetical protein [Mucilaginibacter sp. JRF]